MSNSRRHFGKHFAGSCVALALALTACGGGGGNPNPPAPPDTTAPDTTLAGAPQALTNAGAVTLTFTATEVATFEVRLDGAAFAAATSPHALNNLTDGSHTFEVRARDGAGNVDATPASATWVVDTTPPDVQIGARPSGVHTGDDGQHRILHRRAPDDVRSERRRRRVRGRHFAAATRESRGRDARSAAPRVRCDRQRRPDARGGFVARRSHTADGERAFSASRLIYRLDHDHVSRSCAGCGRRRGRERRRLRGDEHRWIRELERDRAALPGVDQHARHPLSRSRGQLDLERTRYFRDEQRPGAHAAR